MRQLQKGDQGQRQRDYCRIRLASVLILRTLRKANHRVPEETQAAVTGIFLLVPFARRSDFAEETVTLILNACGEEELVGVSRYKAIAEGQSPKALNGDGMALTTAKLTVERVAIELEASDVTVAEIAHKQVAGELSEVIWSQRQAPGRVERAPRGKPLEEATFEVEA